MGSAYHHQTIHQGQYFTHENLRNNFVFNDLTHPGSITAIRVEGTKISTKQRIENLR